MEWLYPLLTFKSIHTILNLAGKPQDGDKSITWVYISLCTVQRTSWISGILKVVEFINGPLFVKYWVPLTQECFVLSCVEMKINYEFRYFFCYFVIRSVCKKRHGLSWMNLNHFNPKMFVPRLIALDFNCRKSKFYKFRHCNFDISLSQLEKLWASLRTKLYSIYSRMLCATFGWNWKSGSTEEDKNVKNLQTDGQPANRKACWSFQLRWA